MQDNRLIKNVLYSRGFKTLSAENSPSFRRSGNAMKTIFVLG